MYKKDFYPCTKKKISTHEKFLPMRDFYPCTYARVRACARLYVRGRVCVRARAGAGARVRVCVCACAGARACTCVRVYVCAGAYVCGRVRTCAGGCGWVRVIPPKKNLRCGLHLCNGCRIIPVRYRWRVNSNLILQLWNLSFKQSLQRFSF